MEKRNAENSRVLGAALMLTPVSGSAARHVGNGTRRRACPRATTWLRRSLLIVAVAGLLVACGHGDGGGDPAVAAGGSVLVDPSAKCDEAGALLSKNVANDDLAVRLEASSVVRADALAAWRQETIGASTVPTVDLTTIDLATVPGDISVCVFSGDFGPPKLPPVEPGEAVETYPNYDAQRVFVLPDGTIAIDGFGSMNNYIGELPAIGDATQGDE